MKRLVRLSPSPSMAVALVALFVALGGVGYAAATGSIDSREIKNNSVRSKDIRNGTVASGDVKNNSVTGLDVRNGRIGSADIADNSLTGGDVNEASLGQVPAAGAANLANATRGLAVIDLKRANPTNGADATAARSAAPKIPLYSKGPFTLYGKCFSYGTTVEVNTYIETSAAGAIFDSREDGLDGGAAVADYLNPDTPETSREVDDSEAVTGDGIESDNDDETDFSAFGPDGTTFRGFTQQGAKRGTVAFSGAFAPGNGCIWSGFVIG